MAFRICGSLLGLMMRPMAVLKTCLRGTVLISGEWGAWPKGTWSSSHSLEEDGRMTGNLFLRPAWQTASGPSN